MIALYNPVSARRRDALLVARDILLEHRAAATPVVLARNLGRADETLAPDRAGRASCPTMCDMLTVVLVGSSTTRRVPRLHGADWVYTPRGYEVAMTVHFIGAGPGAPDLITVRGLRLIQALPGLPLCRLAGAGRGRGRGAGRARG